ncbi:Fic family protein [Geodermatophilus sp. TF02-6]|nr:Fic family protein [Geodermatophilus sp. TF02-6]
MHVPLTPPSLDELLAEIRPERIARVISQPLGTGVPGDDGYLHWDKLLHLSAPEGLTHREWWLRLKLTRGAGRRSVPLLDTEGSAFWFTLPDITLESLHKIDQEASGRIGIADSVTNPATRDRYVITSLMEEAITSSQLEGASTSRRVAKEMLRTGRQPRDRSEQMIVNNFRAMQYVTAHRDQPLTPKFVFEVHRLVTDGTLDNPTAAGRLQHPNEEQVKVWGDGDQLLHTPPPAEELPKRLRALCDFANEGGQDAWIHPVVRSVILHFWLGYDHYFEDGNGRTARAIFYWSMLRQGYWLAEFLTISTILRKAPTTYAQSFLLTETDDNDLTYFIRYHLEVLRRALCDLQDYLERKIREVQEVEALVRGDSGLNHRQRALLGDALRDPHAHYTIEGHRRSHNVVYQTARTDLLDLFDRGLLEKRRESKAFVFVPPSDLSERLRALA